VGGNVSGQEDTATLFAARGFGNRIGFGDRPAILVVDMINGFTDPSLPLGSSFGQEIDATRELLDGARSASTYIFFTAVAYRDKELGDAGIWRRKQHGLVSLRAGTSAVDIDKRLGRRPNEPVIEKKQASAFFGTDLIARLTVRQIDTVIISGCTTSGCVRASAVDACAYGFRTCVVREAVGDRAEAAHLQSLFDLDQKYADVVSLGEVLSYLASIPARR
jgi:maleamate amidohydrolase